MNNQQRKAFELLQRELLKRGSTQELPDMGKADEYVVTKVDEVTVLIGTHGGFILPAVRTYPETGKVGEKAIDAALDPSSFFERQSQVKSFKTGHFLPIINHDWTCGSNSCPCQNEDEATRKHRSTRKH
jgi:hypothetical protein